MRSCNSPYLTVKASSSPLSSESDLGIRAVFKGPSANLNGGDLLCDRVVILISTPLGYGGAHCDHCLLVLKESERVNGLLGDRISGASPESGRQCD